MTNAEFNEILKGLTPENQKKVIAKYYELLAEQEAEEKAAQDKPKYYYFFDCLDGVLSDRYMTAEELAQLLTGAADPMPESEIIRTAANYEATLYRYTLDDNGNPTNEVILYDCAF